MTITFKKTPHLATYIDEVAKANDQLCFYMFADAELESKISPVASTRGKELTPAVFPDNPHSQKIRVTIEELSGFRARQRNQTHGMSFSFVVEQLLIYVEKVLTYWANVNEFSIELKSSVPIEEHLAFYHSKHSKKALNPKLIQTIKYLRLRRNNFIHAAKEPSAELVKFLRYDASNLQKYWAEITKLPGLNFSSMDVGEFSSDECISLIKLSRICIRDIDVSVAENINVETTARSMHKEILRQNSGLNQKNIGSYQIQIRKVRALIHLIHGVKAANEQIANILDIKL